MPIEEESAVAARPARLSAAVSVAVLRNESGIAGPRLNEPGRCGHTYARLQGCRRCIDACGNEAIHPGETVPLIDSGACTGCGECMTACPSGALQMLPRSQETALKQALSAISDCPSPPLVVFHENTGFFSPDTEKRPGIIPIECTPIGALGLETLLAALAAGAAGVLVAPGRQTNSRTQHLLGEQVHWARLLVAALGYPDDSIALLEPGTDAAHFPALPSRDRDRPFPAEVPIAQPKRALACWAIGQLANGAIRNDAVVVLPAGAPYGEIAMDENACTLCMACTALCPTGALTAAGQDAPGLLFREAECIQCGLCVAGCPEKCLRMSPRMHFGAHLNPTVRPLKEDAPFLCARCGAPYASRAMIETISSRLTGHWLFGTETEKRLLRLCRTCRIKAMFE